MFVKICEHLQISELLEDTSGKHSKEDIPEKDCCHGKATVLLPWPADGPFGLSSIMVGSTKANSLQEC